MKLGLLLPNQGVVFGATTVPELLELAERAEASGAFESLWRLSASVCGAGAGGRAFEMCLAQVPLCPGMKYSRKGKPSL